MNDWLERLQTLVTERTAHALVTIVGVSGSAPREVGAKMIVCADGRFFGSIGGGQLEALAIEEAKLCAQSGEPRSVEYPLGAKAGQCCGGVVTLFFDAFGTGPELFIFGGGHVAQALARVMQATPFAVSVIDERQDWLDALPAGVTRHAQPWDAFLAHTPPNDRSYVLVMTHRHDLDEQIIEAFLRAPHHLRYLGLIGSRAKWARFRQRLSAREISAEALQRVRCPIGIPIGGKAPGEVAISIAAELVSLHHAEDKKVEVETAVHA